MLLAKVRVHEDRPQEKPLGWEWDLSIMMVGFEPRTSEVNVINQFFVQRNYSILK